LNVFHLGDIEMPMYEVDYEGMTRVQAADKDEAEFFVKEDFEMVFPSDTVLIVDIREAKEEI
jgi:hypothetical protein